MPTTYRFLPTPELAHAKGCTACEGKGVTDMLLSYPVRDDLVVVTEQLCPACFDHETFTESLSSDDFDDDAPEDDGPDAPVRCGSCRGPGWWPLQAFVDNDVFDVLMPCGCSEDKMTVLDPEEVDRI